MTRISRITEDARRARGAAILEALRAEGGNRARAAKRLGYAHESALYKAIKLLGLRVPKGHTGRPIGAKWSRAERQARMGS